MSAATSLGWSQDSAALAILTNANAALNGTAPVSRAILTGAAAYTAGSDEETGDVTLEASGYFDSKLLMHLSGGTRQEIQRQWGGAWAGTDAAQHQAAFHNSLTSAVWFFPNLVIEGWLAGGDFSVSNIGAEERNGIAVAHVRCVRVLPGQIDATTAALVQQASAMDLFLDAATLLPVALEFDAHPDDNALQNIPVRIEFGDYRAAGSGKAPFRVQKYLQNTLLLDISIGSIDVNAALQESDFKIQ
jgi:hypothetical protein